MRSDEMMRASDMEVVTGKPAAKIALLGRIDRYPAFGRVCRLCVYRRAANIDWLNERHAHPREPQNGA